MELGGLLREVEGLLREVGTAEWVGGLLRRLGDC